ncbi:MAG: hypothetical protein Q9209_000765 [Squamulea sp. 1 TL-2023]
MSDSIGLLEPHPKYLSSRAEAITKIGAIVDALQPPCEHSFNIDKASQITTVILEALQTQCPTSDLDHSLCSNSRPKPNHKYLLPKAEAIEKLKTIIEVLQPPRRGGPNATHVADIVAQLFADLQTQVPEVAYDQSWAAMGRRRKYCMLAEKEVWLPSLAEVANAEEGVYPYVEVFESQLWETRFPEKNREIWTLPLEDAFLREELDALRNMDALFREYDTSSEDDGNDEDDSNAKQDEGYES